jgi:hypothetical protein
MRARYRAGAWLSSLQAFFQTRGSLKPLSPQEAIRKPITQQGLDAIHADFGYALIGTTIYYDAAGTHYRSNYCAWHLANDVTAWCEKHNEIRSKNETGADHSAPG